MRNGFIFLVFSLILFKGYSQDRSLSISYDFHNNSTKIPYILKATLIADKEMSLYTILNSSGEDRKIVNETDVKNDRDENITTTTIIQEQKDIYVYQNLSSAELIYSTSRDNVDYKVEESIPDFNWKLHHEEKLINGLTAKKATTNFRGRHYTAWYIPAIPSPYGPWKFGGLPGLITEVYDDTQTFRWAATSIEYPYKGDLKATEPAWNNYTTLTLREIVEMDATEDDDYFAKLRARLPAGSKLISSSTSRGGIELLYEWEKE